MRVRTAERNEYSPVEYVEPYGGNESALGFDLASEPTRFAALRRALETDRPAATSPFILVQQRDSKLRFRSSCGCTPTEHLTGRAREGERHQVAWLRCFGSAVWWKRHCKAGRRRALKYGSTTRRLRGGNACFTAISRRQHAE